VFRLHFINTRGRRCSWPRDQCITRG